MAKTYNRYTSFLVGNQYSKIPFIEVPLSASDKYTYYKVGETRLDLLSYQYYDDPNYGWFILQANPSAGPLEYKIEDRTKLRIPYPLNTALNAYENEIEKYKRLYGLD